MKKIRFIIIYFLVFTVLSCKTNLTSASKKQEIKDTTISQKVNDSSPPLIDPVSGLPLPCSLPLAPEYKGGNEAMYAFITENLIYPEEAKKRGISGSVIVTFNVLVSGELSDIKVQQGIGYGCDEEALRIVKLMPKWIPGKHLNTPIEMTYSLAILFTLSEH